VVLFIKVNGKEVIEMGLDNRFGLMELNMLEIGLIVTPMEKENFIMLMAINMMVYLLG